MVRSSSAADTVELSEYTPAIGYKSYPIENKIISGEIILDGVASLENICNS